MYFHCARHGTAGKKILLLLLLFQGAASAAHSALTEAHMDERGSRPRCPLACTDLIERRENPPGEICEIVPGHTVGDKVTRQPICWRMTSCVVPHDLQLRVWSRDECATVRGRPLRYYAIVPPNICLFLLSLSVFPPRKEQQL